MLYVLALNVLFYWNGEYRVGTVHHESGNIVYVVPCENYDPLHRIPINKRDIDVTDWSCQKYNELIRDFR